MVRESSFFICVVFSNLNEKSIKESGFASIDENNIEKKEQIVFTICSWSADKAGALITKEEANVVVSVNG